MQKKQSFLLIFLLLAMSTMVQASFAEESEEGAPQRQAKVSLEKWEGKRDEAREAFRPVLKALKFLGDEAAYQVVLDREGDKFLECVRGEAQLGWQQQKIVVAYLKELYDEHTALIGEHADLKDLLKRITSALEREQGRSDNLSRLLQEKTEAYESVEARLQNQVPVGRDHADLFIDLESQSATENSPLLNDPDGSKRCATPFYTKIFYTSVGVVVGAGLTFLGTYLYLKYQP